MRRRLLGAGLALALLAAWLAMPRALDAAGYRMTEVTCSETGRTGIVGEHVRRRSVRLLNVGNRTILIGGTIGSHVGGTNGWPLHAAGAGQYLNQTHALVLFGSGALECIIPNVAAGETTPLRVLEEYGD